MMTMAIPAAKMPRTETLANDGDEIVGRKETPERQGTLGGTFSVISGAPQVAARSSAGLMAGTPGRDPAIACMLHEGQKRRPRIEGIGIRLVEPFAAFGMIVLGRQSPLTP
jgi:hypothetical protein